MADFSARTPVRALSPDDYALVILQPQPAVLRRDEWLRMLPDYEVSGYSVEERIVETSPDLCTVFQRVAV